MKRSLSTLFIAIASLLVVFVQSPLVYGITQNDLNSLANNTPFYDPTAAGADCSNLTGPAGSGPLYGPDFPQVSDVGDLANRIDTYISNTVPSSPLKTLGADFVTAGQKYNINPAMIVGFAYKESSLGTNQPSGSYDAFGLTADGDIPGAPYSEGITDFPSWQASIDPTTKYVSDTYIHGGYNAKTILELMEHYTPPDPEGQTKITLDVMHKILDGISTTASGPTDSAADPTDVDTSDGSCNSGGSTTFTPGVNGYNLTGVNAMANFYQCDPKWANDQYGQAGSICQGGCGITSMTMVVDTLAGANETPATMATKYAAYGSSEGTTWGLWPAAAKDYGLTYTDIGMDFDAAANVIHNGGLVIMSAGPGYFTSGSHLMVIRAVDNQGNFYLADPNGPRPADHQTETKGFSSTYLEQQGVNHLFAFTKGNS